MSDTDDAELVAPRGRVQPHLILVGSAAAGGAADGPRVHRVANETAIGRRAPSARRKGGFVVIEDRCVSTAHAEIRRSDEGYEIVDLGSRNGTFVDGVPVTRQVLRDGALLFFGGYAAVFRFLAQDALTAIEEDQRAPLGPVATVSPAMALALRKLRRLAPTREEVLLSGETGTGKEVYGRAIHKFSGRTGKFIGVNCAAIPNELVESELFGYTRGAHSQASQAKRGVIEEAEGGTLFLDEIGDMPRGAQAKLLRFLQEREVVPLGSATARKVDVRVVAATAYADDSGDQAPMRRDLLMRLGSRPIVLPSLRDRPEDIGALAHLFLGPDPLPFENRAFLALCLHGWPGNVRELQKVVREAVIFSDGQAPLRLEHLPPALGARFRDADPPAPKVK